MNRPYIPEYRKANMTGDFREIALSLSCCYPPPPLRSSQWRDPKYIPFGKTYVNNQYYSFDGSLLTDFTIERYVAEFAVKNNLSMSDLIEDVPGYSRDYHLPCRCWTVKDFLEIAIDDYDIIPSYEKAFKDMFNLEFKKGVGITTQNLEKYVHVMKCVDPDNNNVEFNVVSTAELSNLVKSYAEMLDAENKMALYFDDSFSNLRY